MQRKRSTRKQAMCSVSDTINQKGDKYYNKSGFVRQLLFLERFLRDRQISQLFSIGDISRTPYYNMFR